MALVPQVVDTVDIPVIAAGGIADGRGVAAAFALGADAVQIGTRFLSAKECNIHQNYKNKVFKAGDTATIVTGRRLGHPVRSIRNQFAREYSKIEYTDISDEELDALERQVLQESEAEASEDTDEHTLDNIVYIDTTFHDIIYQAANNQRLVQFLNILQEQLQRFRAASLSRPGRSKTALEEHKQIIEALSERNGELASKLAKEHIDNAESAMIFAMQDGDK
jgi:NAD(P)H-dependent flavin oxidoreductase YrpB (nitropropane dioxygenase family)